MIDELKDLLKLPDPCLVDKKIFKKMFYENFKFSSQDKKYFKDDIIQIQWLYSIKPENSNISEFVNEQFEYKEVAFISIELRKLNSSKMSSRIPEIVHRSIPYGTLIILYDKESAIISASQKRISKTTKDEIVVEEIVSTEPISKDNHFKYLDGFSFSNFDLTNLMQFNLSILKMLVSILSIQKIGQIVSCISDPVEKKRIIDRIENYENKIVSLKKELKNETQFNKKMEINVKIKNIETQVIELKKNIS